MSELRREAEQANAPDPGLRSRIRSAFYFQIAVIALAAVLGVYGARFLMEDVLVRRALDQEASHLGERLRADPNAALPDTYALAAYLAPSRPGDSPVPAAISAMAPGISTVELDHRRQTVRVSDTPAGRLYLVFEQELVSRFAFFFSVVPLVIVLLAIYFIVWHTYRTSKRAVSPVVWLANRVRDWDPKRPNYEDLAPDRLPPDAEGEVELLAGAMRAFAERNEAFVTRERAFTRDASHELRSPLTVVKIAGDMLVTEDALSPFARKNVERIRSAARDMETLIESFLILAREGDTGLPVEDFVANELVLEEAESARPLLAGKPVEFHVDQRAQLELHAPPRVLSVIAGNLIRNACQFTERGHVQVTIGRDHLEVSDTGIGIDRADLERVFEPFFRTDARGARVGHGIGLTIVKRLCDRFEWPIRIDSRRGEGTRVCIDFARAVYVDPAVAEAVQIS